MTRDSASPLPLLQGTVDVLILKALAWAPLHGYGISLWIRERADNRLAVEDAALYQALHRLERKGLVTSEWGVSDANRRARFYSLAKPGRQQLQREVKELRRYFEALFLVLDTP
ncbi:MAG: PadR family transcriptional regulator [Planctomycetes bacterium]|nr:PadR family transcriptional regulator [Planctomycetota bacterium]